MKRLSQASKRRRGAAMVEGVFIFPVILIFFGLLATAHAKHMERYKFETDSREDAFQRAYLGCPESVGPTMRSVSGNARKDPGVGQAIIRPGPNAIDHDEVSGRDYLTLNEPFLPSFYALSQSNGTYSKVYCNTVTALAAQSPSDSLTDWYNYSTRTFVDAF